MLRLKKHHLYFAVYFLQTTPLLADTAIDASLKLLHFDYEEFDESGASFNSETGYIPGVALSFSSTQQQVTSLISIESYDGRVDYDGQTQSGIPHETDTDETLLRLFYRLDWSPENKDNSFYGKIAWQQWDRDILTAGYVSGLFEQYQWWSYEVGISTIFPVDDSSQWQLEFGTSKIDNGSIEIDLSRQGFGRPELNLGDSYGMTAAALYQHTLTDRNTISLGLQYQRWKFGKSNTEYISNGFEGYEIYEPRSTSKHTIVSFNYSFLF